MIEAERFREWLQDNTSYSRPVIRDIVSRIKRADGILEWKSEEIYLFYLERSEGFKKLSSSVRSQLKKSVALYGNYYSAKQPDSHWRKTRSAKKA